MKLVIKDKNNSYLKCKFNNKKDRIVKVSLDNILEWYPLSLAYDLKVDKTGGKLQLCRLTSNLPSHYGDEDKGYIVEEQYIQDVIVFDSVFESNLKLKNKAKKYDITFIDENYNINVVEENFSKIRLMFEEINKITMENYIKTLTPKELKEFNDLDLDTQIDKALRKSDIDLTNAYDELGQLYNMNVIMKKISSIGKEVGYRNRLESLHYMLKE